MNEIEQILNKYDKTFSRIPCWEDGDTARRVELLCELGRKAIKIDEEFCLQGQPRRDEIMAIVGRWFSRRATTKWSSKEMKALKAVLDLQPMDDEIAALDRYYSATIAAKDDYRRRDVVTLLNNWQGEVDRARKWIPARSVAQMVGVRV
jgi:hypothetical protein